MNLEIWGVRLTNRLAAWIAFLIILILIGVYGFSQTLLEGHWRTGLEVPAMGGAVWGLYVTNYIFLIGASAGGFIIAASAHIFNVEKYKPISTLATLLALIIILLPPIFIAADLGRPDRMLHVAYPTPNPRSSLFYVLLTLTLYIILLVLEAWFSMRRRLAVKRRWLTLGFDDLSEYSTERDERILRVLSSVGLPLAVSVHSVTGWIFGLMKSRPFWLSPLMAPIFLSSALVSGVALLIFVCIVVKRFAGFRIEEDTISDLARLLFMMIPIDIFFLLIEVLTVAYAHEPTDMRPLLFLLVGSNAPLFWFELIAGALLPFVILASPRYRRSARLLTLTSLLILVGIWLKRWNLLMAGTLFTHEWFGWAEYPVGSYTPTWVEWSVMTGIYGGAALLFTLLIKLLPVEEEKRVTPTPTTVEVE
jgi:molybdopterin-containing oxidoreductase family membrane subunit